MVEVGQSKKGLGVEVKKMKTQSFLSSNFKVKKGVNFYFPKASKVLCFRNIREKLCF